MSVDRYRFFRQEAAELMAAIGGGLAELETVEDPGEVVTRLLRFAHTLKGAAGVVQLAEVARAAHGLEDVLVDFRDRGAAGPRPVAMAREVADRISRHLAPIGVELVAAPAPGPPREAEEAVRSVRIEVADVDALLTGLADLALEVRQLEGAVGTLRECALSAEVRDAELATGLARIRDGMEGGLRRARSRLEAMRTRLGHLRLLPARVLFPELEAAVRQVSRSCGRKTAFVASGGDLKLDSHVLSGLRGALLHLVRNAAHHGIESPESRLRQGKTPEGTISVEVARRGGRVVIACRDDGRGLDLEAVRRRLVETGMVEAGEAGRLDDPQLVAWMFRPGVSTAEEIGELSGRGVGLDVVRDQVSRLGGEVATTSQPGRGSAFELTVPFQLTSTELLVLEHSSGLLGVPLGSVRSAARGDAGDDPESVDRVWIRVEAAAAPRVAIEDLLATGTSSTVPDRRTWVVVDTATGPVALGARRLCGVRTEAVQPLPRLLEAPAWIVGAFLDEDGGPVPVLDPGALETGSLVRDGAGSAGTGTTDARPTVMVVDDSLTTRMLEQTILESHGYRVVLACSAEEGLDLARRSPPDLILVDVEMPGMDGFQFLEVARGDEALQGIPAIVMTTRGSQDDRRRGMAAGARAYLVKTDFDEAAFLRTVGSLAG